MSHTSLALCCGVDGEAGWWLAVPSSRKGVYTNHNDEYSLWKALTDHGGIRCAWLFADEDQLLDGYKTYRPRKFERSCFIIRESVFRLVRVYRTAPTSDIFRVRVAGLPSIDAAFKQYESELSDADDDDDESSEAGSTEEDEKEDEKEVVVVAPPTPTIIATTVQKEDSPDSSSPVQLESLLLVSVRDLQTLLATTRRYHLTDMLSPTHCRACSSVIQMPQSVPITGLRMQLPPIPLRGITPEMLAAQRRFLSAAKTGGASSSRFIELQCQCAHPPTYFWCRAGVRMIHHVNVADWNEAVASNLPTKRESHSGRKRART